MTRLFFTTGSLFAGLAVAICAATGHGSSPFEETAEIWLEKAIRYQFLHGLALILVAISLKLWPDERRLFTIAGLGYSLGILLFSGSLYFMTFTGISAGYLTPLGGMAFLAGWLALVGADLRLSR